MKAMNNIQKAVLAFWITVFLFLTIFGGKVFAQSNASLWKLTGSNLLPVNNAWNLKIPALSGSGNRCVQVDSTGLFTVTGSACGSGGGISDGDKGDITVSGSGAVWTIDNLAVTNAKINDLAWSKLTSTPTTLSGYGITDAQPLDGDLTAIAALTGTNTIYYRSAASTWTPVTIGSNLTFSGGTLAATSGGMAIGGSITSATEGSVLFVGPSGVLAQDNSKLFWNNSIKNLRGGDSLSIGDNFANYQLNIYGSSFAYFTMNTATTTTSSTRGFQFGIENSGVYLLNRENIPMYFRTNNADRMTILGGGNVGIGNTNPTYQFQVDNSPSSATDYAIKINTGSSSGFSPAWAAFNSGLSAGQNVWFAMGKDETAYNEAGFYYNHVADNSLSNRFSIGFWSANDLFNLTAAGNVGIGTGTGTISARLHTIATTEQLRLGYDTSNYLSATINSTGSATLALTGTSPIFTFSQAIRGNGGFRSSAGNAGATATVNGLTFENGLYISGSVSGSGISSLNGLTGATQTFATGTSGTDFNISSSGTTHTLNIPTASASNRGLLSTADWSTFNSKIGGSGTSTQIPFFTGGSTLSSDSNFTWDNTNKRVEFGTSGNGILFNNAFGLFGNAQPTSNTAGYGLQIGAGTGNGTGTGGQISIQAGEGQGGGSGDGGDFYLNAGDGSGGGGTAGNGGNFFGRAGSAQSGNSNGGNYEIKAGSGLGTGIAGELRLVAGTNGDATTGTIAFVNQATTYKTSLDLSLLTTANQTLTIPNATGTIALTSQLPVASTGLLDTAGTWTLDINGLTQVTPAIDDNVAISDTSDSNNPKKSLISRILALFSDGWKRDLAFDFFIEFMNAPTTTANNDTLVLTNSGTGAGTTQVTNNLADNRPGIVRAATGTTATGRTALSSNGGFLSFGGGTWIFETAINITTLSTSTERYQLPLGFIDTVTAANQVDGAYLLYDEGGVSTGSAASANWQCVTTSNSARTFTTTSTAVATGWVTLRIEMNAAGNSVEMFVNGSSVCTHTTNIPTAAGRETGFGYLMIKSVGTTSRTMDVDYVMAQSEFTSAR